MSNGKIIKFSKSPTENTRLERYRRQKEELWRMVRESKDLVENYAAETASEKYWQDSWLSRYKGIEEEFWVDVKNSRTKQNKEKPKNGFIDSISVVCMGIYCWLICWLPKGKN